MTLEEEVVALRTENALLRTELVAAAEAIARLQARIAQLEQRKTPVPGFVKANTERTERRQPRKKRAPEHNAGRPRAEPTQTVQHAYERCPDCGYLLRGQSIARTREVIDLPPPPPVEVTEHQLLKRYCPVCQRWQVPSPDWSGQVLGQGRLGVRLVSLLAYLRTEARLPVRTIQEYLATLHQVHLSTGAIVDLLARLRDATADERAALLAQARASPLAHMDETGWRENGQNGYVWGLTTPGPAAVRYYHYDHSRAGEVATDLLGDFDGHLGSDFYGGYNAYSGKHQRCWTHLLRDLHDLKTAHADDAEVSAWARDVRVLYDEAQAALRGPAPLTPPQREALYRHLEDRAHVLGLAHAGVANKAHPCHALCHRLLRHQGELFQFVRVPGLSADNNAAERMLRPLVITRKISGGSRTPAGTATRMALSTLFGTWKARGLNTFHACLSLLHSALPQI
jgi:transposase